ncbi:uncharacterized protein DSM5745_02738 [Aspergillus mulundensis]|uniref:Uncharacterized protein n=1 Tax=Aspergillus mulundensis TaxID=1810919 RepID=A0A3D8SII1_9EURO|nr:hypothetical protein DSM5745_02738 [Aspergillus mulundensis]RDW86096.1 hypothetical protein DSM5745_02738 [Aspergillus mulundensis]
MDTSLYTACENPSALFSTPPESLLHQIYREFTSDINRLKRAYSVRDAQASLPNSCPSPSHILFGQEYDEVNRTLVGLLALRWIHRGEYEGFIGEAPSETRLSRESFDWIRDLYALVITYAESPGDALYTLLTLIITNDLGKDPELACEYRSITGTDISDSNHDAILLKAYEAGLIPSLDRLPGPYKQAALSGLKLASKFNLGQLAQAENAPVCFSALLEFQEETWTGSDGGDEGVMRAFNLRFMEQLLDIAGAGGHMDWTCAAKLNEAVFDSYRGVYEACYGVFEGRMSCEEAYDVVLRRRAAFLMRRGVDLDFDLSINQTSGNTRAFMRLLCMGNVTTADVAELYESTWEDLDPRIKEELEQALNVLGTRGKPAIQPTYMPAFLSGIKNRKELDSALRFLHRVVTAPVIATETESGDLDPSVVVIERSVLGILKEFVEPGLFHEDPIVLDAVGTPKGVVALRQ